MNDDLVLVSTTNAVRTLTYNLPRRLNGWTLEMMNATAEAMAMAAQDDGVKALILTGADPYYSAGVNLSSTIQLTHPRQLRQQIVNHNQALFDRFLDFDKPILVAANGPAIGATVTSATLCDGIIASEKATFSTPFAKLGVTPEGCSSVHLPNLIGSTSAERMLGSEGWIPSAQEAFEVGLVDQVVAHGDLMGRAQTLAESWVAEGKTRSFKAGATREGLKQVNAKESEALGDAFLASKFLMGQAQFLWSRKKYGPALTFFALSATRPAWARFL